jgi:hypothetical protein
MSSPEYSDASDARNIEMIQISSCHDYVISHVKSIFSSIIKVNCSNCGSVLESDTMDAMTTPKRNRGKAPNDDVLFSPQKIALIAEAVSDFSFLMTREYGETSALQIVGDRYQLHKRQRMMVLRASCSERSRKRRRLGEVSMADAVSHPLYLDGLNLLITLECALSGGIVFSGRDSVVRDIAGVHGTYRKGLQTAAAIHLLVTFLKQAAVSEAHFYLDAPVSNSGRIKQMLLAEADRCSLAATAVLVNNPDSILIETDGIVATSDGWILDNVSRWLNLVTIMYQTPGLPFNALLIDGFGATSPDHIAPYSERQFNSDKQSS